MSKPIVISVLGDTDHLNSKLGESESRLSRFGGAAGKVGAVVAGGLLAAGAAAGVMAVKAVGAASNAQQSIGATETVYGKYADTVIKKSDEAAKAVGLSANAYRENSNLLGALLKNQGVEQSKLAGSTDALIKTGADLAATYGGTTTDAVGALSAAFKGEFDSLERYGISLKASTIAAELAARGQDKLTGAALAAAQQQVTTDLITRQAGDALGAFGRETGTLAHQQQVLGAQVENLSAKAGSVLLPILTSLAMFASSTLLPALERMGPPIMAFAQVIAERAAPVIATLGGFLTGTLVPALSDVAGFVIGTVVPAVTNLAGKIAGNLAPVFTTYAGVVTNLIGKFREWSPTIVAVLGDVGRLVARVLTFASAIVGTVLPPVIRFAGFLIGTLVPAVFAVIGGLARGVTSVLNFGAAFVDGVKDVGRFAGAVLEKIGQAIDYVREAPGKARDALAGIGTALLGAGRDLIQGLINGITEKVGELKGYLNSVTDLIPDWKGPAAKDKRLLTPAGRSIMDGLITGIDDRLPDLRSTLTGVTGVIAGTTVPALTVGGTGARARFTSTTRAGAGATMRATVDLGLEALHQLERGRRVAIDLGPYLATGGTL